MSDNEATGGSSRCKPGDPGYISVFSIISGDGVFFLHLGALFDGRGDMVETDGALEEGEQGVGVDGPQLEVRLLHQHRLHPRSFSS